MGNSHNVRESTAAIRRIQDRSRHESGPSLIVLKSHQSGFPEWSSVEQEWDGSTPRTIAFMSGRMLEAEWGYAIRNPPLWMARS
jgi:hypothetical protein